MTLNPPVPQTRERILQAVVDGLQELDPGALTIQQVCRRARVKAPSVYYYFGNKDGLIAAAVEDMVSRWITALDALVDRSVTLDLAAAQAVHAWTLMIVAPERPFAVFVWVSMWSQQSRLTLIRAREHARALIRDAIRRQLADPPNADELATLLLDGILGASVDFQLDGDPDALTRRLTTLIDVAQLRAQNPN